MDKLIKYFFMCGAIVLASCKTIEQSKEKSSSASTKDSVNVSEKVTIREKLVYSSVDSAGIKALVICPDGKPADIKQTIARGHKQATAIFQVKDGVASVECLCDSLAMRLQEVERERDVWQSRAAQMQTSEKFSETIKVPYIPKWARVLIGLGLLSCVYWAFKLYKFFV